METKLAHQSLLAGRYAYRRELGRGASGRVVLAADHAAPDTLYAIKLVRPEEAERLRWEFSLLARLSHPGLARVVELLRVDAPVGGGFGLAPGASALVEEYVPGPTLAEAARELRDEPAQAVGLALRVGEQVGRALGALHAVGLVHGDVKPANLVAGADGACKLLDLGLAQPAGASASAAGTPPFMASEVWQGQRIPANDLYALGVTLELVLQGGREPAQSGEAIAVAFARATGTAPRPPLPAELPPDLLRIMTSLLCPEPALRPSALEAALRFRALAGASSQACEAREAARAVEPSAEERMLALEVLPLRGREQELGELLEKLREHSLVVVAGPAGSGRSRLVREAVRALQTERARAEQPVPTYHRSVSLPGSSLAGQALVHVLRASAEDGPKARALVLARTLEQKSLQIVLEAEDWTSTDGVPVVRLQPLPPAELGALLRSAGVADSQRPSVRDAALEASAGLPGRLCRLLAEGFRLGRRADRPLELLLASPRGASERVALGIEARDVADLLLAAGGRLEASCVTQCLGDGERVARGACELVRLGLAAFASDGQLALRPDVARTWRRAAPAPELRSLARRLLGRQLPPRARAFALAAAGQVPAALVCFEAELRRIRKAGRSEQAAALGRWALSELPQGSGREQLALEVADALRASADYAGAEVVLAGRTDRAGLAARAELARLRGDFDRARRLAAEVDSEVLAAWLCAQALVARLLLDAGEPTKANERARSALQAGGLGVWREPEATVEAAEVARVPAAVGRLYEVVALAELQAGQLPAAREAAGRALRVAEARREFGNRARALSVSASIALAAGEVATAARGWCEAFEAAEGAGEVHTAAMLLSNVGHARLYLGELGPALLAYQDSCSRLAGLGREVDLGQCLHNLAYASFLVGDDGLGRVAVTQAQRLAKRLGQVWIAAYAALIEAEFEARGGNTREARASLERLRHAEPPPALAARQILGARTAQLLLQAGEIEEAGRYLHALETEPGSEAAAVEQLVTRSRIELAHGQAAGALALAEHAVSRAQRARMFDLQLRAVLLAASLAEAAKQPELARVRLAEARRLLDRAASTLPPPMRARFRRVPEYQAAFRAAPQTALTSGPASDGRWRRLAQLTRHLVREHRVSRLFDAILDAAIELAGAERGYLVVRDSNGRQHVRAARGIDRRTLRDEEQTLSRSILNRVLSDGRAMSTVDALRDARLDAALSVHSLALRSVVSLPLFLRGEVGAAIYLDDRLRPFAFAEQELALLESLAQIASAALEGAQLLQVERRSARRTRLMRAQLARQVETQACELEVLRRGAGVEAEFPGLIAHSSAMREALRLASRVAASELPVLVVGESGTGKELVARAVHQAGPRGQRAFVSENCSAIPEALLESALFGHVRGAFTGAERRRMGLFEAADGGTLFLDEVGEMSSAMQARLLRVLQDGELRPVGGERTRKVDVRVIAATHRDLPAMVDQGTFREDLYYRLAVVRIALPPLRTRREDIAPLVAHLIRKHAGDRRLRIDKRALGMLVRFDWPGNVRQLENELRRSLLLAENVIEPEHLSPELGAPAGVQPAEFDLKAQVRALERQLIDKALERTRGNHTQAAKLLRLSRYGLQKMIKRLDRVSADVERRDL